MAQTYSTTDLALNDPTSADWALAYVRFALRDKPNENSAYPSGSLDDAEINAALEAEKIQDSAADGGDNAYYYLPHRVAARLIMGNPAWVTRWSVGGYSEQRPSIDAAARGIRAQGRWIDRSIATLTGKRIGGVNLELAL